MEVASALHIHILGKVPDWNPEESFDVVDAISFREVALLASRFRVSLRGRGI